MTPSETKPRSDAILKNLPDDRQAEINEYANSHSLSQTIDWLSANGVQVSICSLSRFLSWHRLRQQLAKNDLVVRELLTELPRDNPDLTPARVSELGQVFFSSLALEKQDPRAWHLAEEIGLHRAQFQLLCRKYEDQIRERKEAIQRQLDAAKSCGGISPETLEKIEHELHLF